MQIPFLQARNYTKANRTKIDLIVIHDMEYPERYDAAEQVARYFSGSGAPQASAHYCIDADSIVQCVRVEDVAWHAPGANNNGIGLEHAGYAAQRPADWADAFSEAELQMSARLTAELCRKYTIPVKYVDSAGLAQGQRGITTHVAVSKAFRKSDHSDPGPNFPMDHYIALVLGTTPLSTPAATKEEMRVSVNAPVVAILTHQSWNGGYLEIGADGGVFSFGDAPNFGSMGATKLAQPVVGGAVTASGQGYWLVARDGGVFSFGDAAFKGAVQYSGA